MNCCQKKSLPENIYGECTTLSKERLRHKCSCCDNKMLDKKYLLDNDYEIKKDFYITVGENNESSWIEDECDTEKGDKICKKCLDEDYFWCDICECYININSGDDIKIIDGSGQTYCDYCFENNLCFQCDYCHDYFEDEDKSLDYEGETTEQMIEEYGEKMCDGCYYNHEDEIKN